MPGGSEIASSVLPASSAAWTAWRQTSLAARTHARTHAASLALPYLAMSELSPKSLG
jgi:hypothetical protein